MAKNITISTVACDGKDCIKVDKHLVRVHKQEVIKFKNDMSADANIQFFDADDKGSATPLSDFCDGISGTTLVVKPFSPPNDKKKECKMTEDVGDFAYTITAANHIDLDPIIIIEPSMTQSYGLAQSQSGAVSPILCIIIPVVAALIAFWLGSRVRSGSG